MSNSAYRKLSANTIDGVYSPRNYFPNPTGSVNTAGAALYSDTQTATMTIASPAVVTVTSTTSFYAGMPLIFTTTGALPTGVTSGTTYYITSVDSGTTFKFSATLGGSNVNTSGSQSGTHTFRPLVPVTGTGGTATGLTLSSSTSSPIRFDANYLLAQTNSTIVAGRGLSFDFSIDDADKAKVQQIRFDYNASSTFVASSGQTSSDSDLKVFIYDVTNAVLIPVSPAVITANGSNNYTFTGTFQTASNSGSYRLCIHAATNSANATGWSFKLSGGYIGSQVIPQGSPVTDWVSYTPTYAGLGTVTASSVYYRRVGDSVEIKGNFTTGTTSATPALISLPTGLTADSSKQPSTLQIVGVIDTNANPTGTYVKYIVAQSGSSNLAITRRNGGTADTPLTLQNANAIIDNSAVHSFSTSLIPISGWSSNVQMSNDTSSRVVAAIYKGAFANVTANNPIKFPTLVKDTHASYSVSTGQFTAPVSGGYSVSAFIDSNAAAGSFVQVYVDGTVQYTLGSLNSSNQGGGSADVFVTAGQTIDVRCSASITASGATSQLSISRIAGPSQIAAVDTVAGRYHGATATITGSDSNITYSTKDFDTTGSYSGATLTIPVSGKYQFNAALSVTGTFTVTQSQQLSFYKNGVQISNNLTQAGGSQSQIIGQLCDIINCVAGDLIIVKVASSATSPTVTSTNVRNFFSWVRVGN